MRIMVVFATVALAELGTFLAVQGRIGLLPTLLIALATAILGSMLVRRAGMSVWSQLQRKIASGGLPTKELSHGAAILVAGAFLISPGFITDAMGFLLLVPAVRDRVHLVASKRMQNRVTVVTSNFGAPAGGGFGAPPGAGFGAGGPVIDAESWEVTDEEQPRGQLP
ncbi:MAG: FxsA family protein [Acidimicrobiia bacterium]